MDCVDRSRSKVTGVAAGVESIMSCEKLTMARHYLQPTAGEKKLRVRSPSRVFCLFFRQEGRFFFEKKAAGVSGRLRVDPRREYFASRFAALPRPVVFLRKGAASVRGRLLVNPRCEYCASALLPAQCRFAAWAGGVSGWHNYDLFYNRASRAPNIGGFLLTRLLLERLLLGPFWLERRLL